MLRKSVCLALLVGSLASSMLASNIAPAAAATEAVTGTATTSGGNGSTTQDWVYSSPGLLGSGTIHNDFVLIFGQNPLRTEGTAVITRADGATLTATGTGTVDLSSYPYPVVANWTVTSGTGTLAGVTGEIVLSGTSRGPGMVGDVFTMSGTLTTPQLVPTNKDQCKHGGWQDLADDQGQPFANQGRCVSYVAARG